jgi:hypothetical protein
MCVVAGFQSKEVPLKDSFAVTFFEIKLRSQKVPGGPLDDNAGKEENAPEGYSEDYR